jgi:hypothetical protein
MLPIIICLIFLFLGYFQPKKMGWLFLTTAPIGAYLTNWIILDDVLFPLRFNQLIFSVAIGILLNKNIYERLTQVLPKIHGVVLISFFYFGIYYWTY